MKRVRNCVGGWIKKNKTKQGEIGILFSSLWKSPDYMTS